MESVAYTEASHSEGTGIFSTVARVILMRLDLVSLTEETMKLVPCPPPSGMPGMLQSGFWV